MPRSSDATIAAILDAGFSLLFEKGFARVGVDEVAARAGVTKKTLYYHFRSKDDLAAAILARQSARSLAESRKWADPAAATPRAFIDSLLERYLDWIGKRGWTGAGFTRLVFELADLPGHPVREVASRHKRAINTWLTDELTARGAPNAKEAADTLQLLLEGASALSLIHRDAAPARAMLAAARRVV